MHKAKQIESGVYMYRGKKIRRRYDYAPKGYWGSWQGGGHYSDSMGRVKSMIDKDMDK